MKKNFVFLEMLAAVLAFIVMGCSSPLETDTGVQSEGGR
jgi:hypothetical protein